MDKQQLEGDALMQLYQQLGEELSRQPGVKGVSFQFIVPLSHVTGPDYTPRRAGAPHMFNMNSVAPDYFETMRIPLYLGRDFGRNDTKASGLKIILNQSAAQGALSRRDALGQQVMNPRKKTSYEVVAVVGDTKYQDLREAAPQAPMCPSRKTRKRSHRLTQWCAWRDRKRRWQRPCTSCRHGWLRTSLRRYSDRWTMCSTRR